MLPSGKGECSAAAAVSRRRRRPPDWNIKAQVKVQERLKNMKEENTGDEILLTIFFKTFFNFMKKARN